jgi:hypothetical protein
MSTFGRRVVNHPLMSSGGINRDDGELSARAASARAATADAARSHQAPIVDPVPKTGHQPGPRR